MLETVSVQSIFFWPLSSLLPDCVEVNCIESNILCVGSPVAAMADPHGAMCISATAVEPSASWFGCTKQAHTSTTKQHLVATARGALKQIITRQCIQRGRVRSIRKTVTVWNRLHFGFAASRQRQQDAWDMHVKNFSPDTHQEYLQKAGAEQHHLPLTAVCTPRTQLLLSRRSDRTMPAV